MQLKELSLNVMGPVTARTPRRKGWLTNESRRWTPNGLLNLCTFISLGECALCCAAMALFYCITGMVMRFGLYGVLHDEAMIPWLRYQPDLALVSAAFFLLLVLTFLGRKGRAMRIVRIGVSVFLGFQIMNGAVLCSVLYCPIAGIFSVGIVGVGIVTGVLFVLALERYHLTMQHEEVRET